MFLDIYNEADTQNKVLRSLKTTSNDIKKLIRKTTYCLSDLPELLSPALSSNLEIFAQKSELLTRQKFGKTIQLFSPIYLSNECLNHCTYCGTGFCKGRFLYDFVIDKHFISMHKTKKKI